MRHLPSLLLVFALGLTLTSCLEDTLENVRNVPDGFSTDDLRFNDEEFAVLSQELDLSQDIHLQSTRVPRHLQGGSGLENVIQTEAEARMAVLGRVLFYDNRLSATGETNCSSCHLQEAAFSDVVDFSEGIRGQDDPRPRRSGLGLCLGWALTSSGGAIGGASGGIPDLSRGHGGCPSGLLLARSRSGHEKAQVWEGLRGGFA